MQQPMSHRHARKTFAHTCLALALTGFIATLAESPAVAAEKSAPGSPAASSAKATDATVGTSQGGGMDMHATMMQGMQQLRAMRSTGDADRDFVTMMRMHHQGAIDMAKVELRQGKDPKLKEIARNLVASQQKEITEFDDWLAKHSR